MRLKCLACVAAIAFLAMPALAASGPPDLALPALDIQRAAVADDASNVCMFAIVESAADCTITVAAVAGTCPTIVARVIGALGGEAIATPAFLAACPPPRASPPE